MMFKEIIAVYCENYTKPINILCVQNVELLYVNVRGTSMINEFTRIQKCKTIFSEISRFGYLYSS
jgi:hypothetical protein